MNARASGGVGDMLAKWREGLKILVSPVRFRPQPPPLGEADKYRVPGPSEGERMRGEKKANFVLA
jgi:hypothetical protein